MNLLKKKKKSHILVMEKNQENILFASSSNQVWVWNTMIVSFEIHSDCNISDRFIFITLLDEQLICHESLSYYYKDFDKCAIHIIARDGTVEVKNIKYCILNFLLFNHYVLAEGLDSTHAYDPFKNYVLWSLTFRGRSFNSHGDYFLMKHHKKPTVGLYNKRTGREKWVIELSKYIYPTTVGTRDVDQAEFDGINSQWVLNIAGEIMAIDAETGQIKWVREPLTTDKFIFDEALSNLYFIDTNTKYKEELIDYKVLNAINGHTILTKEWSPKMLDFFKYFTDEVTSNVSFSQPIGIASDGFYFAIRNLGFLYKADKLTGDILEIYKSDEAFGSCIIYNNHLLIVENRDDRESNSLLIFEV